MRTKVISEITCDPNFRRKLTSAWTYTNQENGRLQTCATINSTGYSFSMNVFSGGGFEDAILVTFVNDSDEKGYEAYYRWECVEVQNVAESENCDTDALRVKSKMDQVYDIYWRLREQQDVHALERMEKVLDGLISHGLIN
jgi:thymidylate synthase